MSTSLDTDGEGLMARFLVAKFRSAVGFLGLVLTVAAEGGDLGPLGLSKECGIDTIRDSGVSGKRNWDT